MSFYDAKTFDDGSFSINLSCVYDSTLAGEENENVRFTKASPYGSGEMTIAAGPQLPEAWLEKKWSNVYLIFHAKGDVPSFDECICALTVGCQAIIDQGYTKQIELVGLINGDIEAIPEEKRIGKGQKFFAKLGIDNPGAYEQFRPTSHYWVTVYDADTFTIDQALRAAMPKV